MVLKGKEDFIRGAKEAGFEDDEAFIPENGENGEDCFKRVEEFIGALIKSTSSQDKLTETNKNDRTYKFLIATHGGWIMRFLRLLNQYKVTNPDLHCNDVKDYQSLSSGKGIVNTGIFHFEMCSFEQTFDPASYQCSEFVCGVGYQPMNGRCRLLHDQKETKIKRLANGKKSTIQKST